jgi:hypothetical protein
MDRLRIRLSKFFAKSGRMQVHGLVRKPSGLPDEIPKDAAILVGSSLKRLEWIVFDCPCGRGHQVMVNLSTSRKPTWRFKGLRTVSLWPSVDDLSIDRCHYVVRDGQIHWT